MTLMAYPSVSKLKKDLVDIISFLLETISIQGEWRLDIDMIDGVITHNIAIINPATSHERMQAAKVMHSLESSIQGLKDSLASISSSIHYRPHEPRTNEVNLILFFNRNLLSHISYGQDREGGIFRFNTILDDDPILGLARNFHILMRHKNQPISLCDITKSSTAEVIRTQNPDLLVVAMVHMPLIINGNLYTTGSEQNKKIIEKAHEIFKRIEGLYDNF